MLSATATNTATVVEEGSHLAFHGVFVSAAELLDAAITFDACRGELDGLDRIIMLQQRSGLMLKGGFNALSRLPVEVMLIIRSLVLHQMSWNPWKWDEGEVFPGLAILAMCEDCLRTVTDHEIPHWAPEEEKEEAANAWMLTRRYEATSRYHMGNTGYPDYCEETRSNYDNLCETAYTNTLVLALLDAYNLKSSVCGYRPKLLNSDPPICQDSNQFVVLTSIGSDHETFCDIVRNERRAEGTPGPGLSIVVAETGIDASEFFGTVALNRNLTRFLRDLKINPASESQVSEVSARAWKRFQAELELTPGTTSEPLNRKSEGAQWWIWGFRRGATNEAIEAKRDWSCTYY